MLLRIRYWFEYAIVMIFMTLISPLPLAWIHWISCRIGNLAYFLFRKRRDIAYQNLSRAFGDQLSDQEKDHLIWKSFEHMVTSVVELFLIRKVLKNPKRFFKVIGQEHLDEAFRGGKGAMFVISHLGSWEYLAFLTLMTGYAASTVVKTIKSYYLDKKIKQLRTLTGLSVIHKDAAAREVMRNLKKNHIVAILTDQWAGPDGLWVEFFGEATSTTSIPVRFAFKTGCALLPAYCVRKGPWEFEIHIEPIVPVNASELGNEIAVTRKLNAILETQILAHPDQWTWVHRRWKPKPQGASVRRSSVNQT